eukprot:TRINITY_DN7990_c0_g1_i3.p1 TRINITY_DN7990_c0_g1~~TRINITY_DN7990_c0_g1_i3.p1  ORF type:complete len:197 (+),score=65.90 TRINITY_DN7990_c0_g1_i3:141-731(+)
MSTATQTKQQQQQATAFEKQLRKSEAHATTAHVVKTAHEVEPILDAPKHLMHPAKPASPKPQRAKVVRAIKVVHKSQKKQKKKISQKAPAHHTRSRFDSIMELGEDATAATPSGWDPIKLLQISEDQHNKAAATTMSSSELQSRLLKIEAAARKSQIKKAPKLTTAALKKQLAQADRTNVAFEAKLTALEKLANQK